MVDAPRPNWDQDRVCPFRKKESPPSLAKNQTFVGIDLAWQSDRNTTGAAVLHGSRSGAELETVSKPLDSTDAVLAFIRAHAGSGTVTGIDAPLIIPNETGMRACERLVGKRYGVSRAEQNQTTVAEKH